jgi:Lrp/AsnC family leucine-responsive transcriptional regulator
MGIMVFLVENFEEKAMDRTLDQIDKKILKEIQRDGRLSNVELAKRVNLSPSPCLERVRRLEREGYITHYAAIVDPRKLNAGLLVFIEVSLDRTSQDVFSMFKEAVVELEEVMECHMIAGGFDYLLKVRLRDMIDYRRFLGSSIDSLPGIKSTRTYVCMEDVKSTHIIPIRLED